MLETICVRIEYEVGVQGIDNVLGTRNGDEDEDMHDA